MAKVSDNDTAPESDPAGGADHPWLGLVPYGENDAAKFFGRENESAELNRVVQRGALSVVFGPSGTGKSSLLNAGLFPRLREEQYLPIVIRIDHSGHAAPRQQIKSRIDQAIASHAIEVAPLNEPVCGAEAEETVWEYLHRVEFWDRRNRPVTPVLVFDQFEEVFTLGHQRPGTGQFIEELSDLVENYVPAVIRRHMSEINVKLPQRYGERPYKIVLTLRDDFVSRLDSLSKVMPSIMYNRFSLERMNGEQALDVILKPGGHLVDESVAREIVEFVAAKKIGLHDHDEDLDAAEAFRNQQIEPALLSLVCRELNTRRIDEGQSKITSEQVRESSDDILEDFYERSFEEINPMGGIFVEDRLVTASGFRSTVSMEDATEAGLLDVEITILIDRRLIRKEDRLGIPHLELTHDVLTTVVRKRRDARKEREIQEEERRLRAEQARRTRKILLTVASAACVFLVFAIVASVLWKRAEEQAQINLNRKLLSKAEAKRESGEFDLPLLLRAAAFHFYSPGLTDIRNEEVAPAYFQSLSDHLWSTFRHDDRAVGVTSNAAGNGVRFASASNDGTIGIWEWDPEKPENGGERIATLRGHSGMVRVVVWSRDHRLLASGGEDGKVRIWNSDDWSKPPVTLEGHADAITALAWHEDGKRLASAGLDGSVRIWSVENSSVPPVVLSGHDELITALSWSPTGDRLASASNDGSVLIWEPETGENLPIEASSERVNAVAWNRAGTRVASASDDRAIRVWDANSGEELRKLIGHNDEVWSLDWDNESDLLASGDKTGEIRIWDGADSEADVVPAILTLSGHNDSIRALRWDERGTRLVSTGDDNTVRVWFPEDPGGPADRLRDEMAKLGDIDRMSVLFLSWAGDGFSFAASGLQNSDGVNVVRIWSAKSFGEPRHILAHGNEGAELVASWNGDQTRLAISSGKDVEVWDTTNGGTLRHTLGGHEARVRALAWDRTGSRLASADEGGGVLLWDAGKESEPIRLENGRASEIKCLSWNGNGSRLASGCRDGSVQIWDALEGKLLRTLEDHQKSVNSVAWNNDGRWLASASDDGTARLWEEQSGERRVLEHRNHNGELSPVSVVVWNPAGSLMIANLKGNVLASGSEDQQIRIWNADKGGDPLYILRGHGDFVTHLAWNPEGTRLASIDFANDLRIWKFDEASWRRWAQRIVNRNFTEAEWLSYVGKESDYPYRKVFPELQSPGEKR